MKKNPLESIEILIRLEDNELFTTQTLKSFIGKINCKNLKI
jgi:hypothetical protein